MVFFTRFGAYSATCTPAFAGTSSAMPRACPSFERRGRVAVDEGRLDGRLVGAESSTMRVSPSWIVTSRSASDSLSLVSTEPQATIDQPVALAADQAPAGAAEARIDAEDANRLSHRAPLIAPAAPSRHFRSMLCARFSAGLP